MECLVFPLSSLPVIIWPRQSFRVGLQPSSTPERDFFKIPTVGVIGNNAVPLSESSLVEIFGLWSKFRPESSDWSPPTSTGASSLSSLSSICWFSSGPHWSDGSTKIFCTEGWLDYALRSRARAGTLSQAECTRQPTHACMFLTTLCERCLSPVVCVRWGRSTTTTTTTSRGC